MNNTEIKRILKKYPPSEYVYRGGQFIIKKDYIQDYIECLKNNLKK